MPEYNVTDLTITVKFNAQLDSEKKVDENSPKYPYTATVTYDNVADAVEKAGKFTVWALARRARKGDLPRDGRTITVNGEGEYHKTVRDHITDMSADQRMALFLELKAQLEAAPVVDTTESTPEESNDSEELTEEQLEQATAPVPAKNEGRNKTGRKN